MGKDVGFSWFPKDEWLLAAKADVVPSETARLTDLEGAVVDDGKQGLVIQGTAAEKKDKS